MNINLLFHRIDDETKTINSIIGRGRSLWKIFEISNK